MKWVAYNNVDEQSRNTLLDIVDTPISPELIPADNNGNIKQKTEDLVGHMNYMIFSSTIFCALVFVPPKYFS